MIEQKDLERFWKWCGFREATCYLPNVWLRPDDAVSGTISWADWPDYRLPPIDLNSLFKWAVPKLYAINHYYELLQWNTNKHKVVINKKTVEWTATVATSVADTPEEALFRAILAVIDHE